MSLSDLGNLFLVSNSNSNPYICSPKIILIINLREIKGEKEGKDKEKRKEMIILFINIK